MGCELVSASAPLDGATATRSPVSFADTFRKYLPYYLSIGMTWEQYWDGSPDMVIYYRQADDLRQRRKNDELWLQGMYIYDALCSRFTTPVPVAFTKGSGDGRNYPDQPYPLKRDEAQKRKEEKEKALQDKVMNKMRSFMNANNKRRKEKAVNSDANG